MAGACTIAYNHPFTLKKPKTYQSRHFQSNKYSHICDNSVSAA